MVAPYAGAWIEITEPVPDVYTVFVAPYAGAWIEINFAILNFPLTAGRTLRGCVD